MGNEIFDENLDNKEVVGKNFENGDFSNGNFSKFRMKGCVFHNCDFGKSVFNDFSFIDCKFINCGFIMTEFSPVEFINCRFNKIISGTSGMMLRDAQIDNCEIMDSNIINSHLHAVRMTNCEVYDVELSRTETRNCKFLHIRCRNLIQEGTSHDGNEMIDVDFR